MKDEQSDFTNLMMQEGVKPIEKKDRAELDYQQKRDDLVIAERRKAAVDGEEQGLTTDRIELLTAQDFLEWKRDGVQEGVYRNLRLGKYQVDARLDLYKKTVTQSRDDLLTFIASCIKYDIRTVLISYGRGQQGVILKSYLNCWLPQLPEVMAFHTAQTQHGGSSAIYLLLRKSEEKRLENWEQHQKR